MSTLPDKADPLRDRVFILVWKESDMARLRSIGSGDMFWEGFRVEPLVEGALLDKLGDAEAWGRCEFVMRHERTGIVLEHVFSAGGKAPSGQKDGLMSVSMRGTYLFAPPAPPDPFVRRVGAALRGLVRGLVGG